MRNCSDFFPPTQTNFSSTSLPFAPLECSPSLLEIQTKSIHFSKNMIIICTQFHLKSSLTIFIVIVLIKFRYLHQMSIGEPIATSDFLLFLISDLLDKSILICFPWPPFSTPESFKFLPVHVHWYQCILLKKSHERRTFWKNCDGMKIRLSLFQSHHQTWFHVILLTYLLNFSLPPLLGFPGVLLWKLSWDPKILISAMAWLSFRNWFFLPSKLSYLFLIVLMCWKLCGEGVESNWGTRQRELRESYNSALEKERLIIWIFKKINICGSIRNKVRKFSG